jgi:hypothetical protein
MINNLAPASQFPDFEIHHDETCSCISLGQQTFIPTIVKSFIIQNAYGQSTRMDQIVKPDVANHRVEPDKCDMKEDQAIVSPLMCVPVAAKPNISFTVTALC